MAEFSHNLRGNLNVISYAAHFLKDGLSRSDREELQELLSRNLATTQSMLDELISTSRWEADRQTHQIKAAITTLSVLLSHLQTDLTGMVSTDIQRQIDQLKQGAETFI